MSTPTEDERWMREAIAIAEQARARGDVPVGALVVHEDKKIAQGFNLREAAQDPTAHAELIAVRGAAARLRTWRLEGCTVYVTLEPCPMCAGMLVASRVARVVFGALDPKAGALESLYRIGDDERLNHRFETLGGVLAEPCGDLLRDFFRAVREGRKRR